MSVQPLIMLSKETGVQWQLTYEDAGYTLDTRSPVTRTKGPDLVAVVSAAVRKVQFELDIHAP